MVILSICVGRNCRQKSADKLFYYCDQRIRECHLEAEIESRIHLCTNQCEQGPIAYLNHELIYNIKMDKIDSIIQQVK